MITWKELRAKSMPPEKAVNARKDWIAHYVLRPVSDMISIPLIAWHVSATSVSMFSALPVLFALGVGIFGEGKGWFLIAWLGLFIWNLLDGVDGNIARYTDTCSAYGDLWDSVVGYLAMFVHYFIMGIMAFKATNHVLVGIIPDYYYIIMGALAGMMNLFPRLAMQKKQNISGEASVKELKKRSDFGFVKTLVQNIMSINGLGAMLFLAAILIDLLDVCMVFYFVFMTLFASATLFVLMRK